MDTKGYVRTFIAVVNLVIWVVFLPFMLIYFAFSGGSTITLLEDVSWTNYAISGGYALVLIFGILALVKKSTVYLLISISGWGIMFLGNYSQATAMRNETEFACNTLRQIPNCVEDLDGTIDCNPGSVYVGVCHGIPK